jgi:hypothetical protein
MKTLNRIFITVMCLQVLSLWAQTNQGAASPDSVNRSTGGAQSPGLSPTLDSQGRFWVYRNGPSQPRMPFTPYGWMSDITNNLLQMIKMDLEHRENPNTAFRIMRQSEKEGCIRLQVKWDNASWAGIAFISGPDKPAWWGDTSRGRHYNLNKLPKKKLVLYARGAHGGEVIKVQLGALAGKPFGDSLSKPFTSEDLKLAEEWARHEVDLQTIPAAELSSVSNGFGIIVDQGSQPGPGVETEVYVDDVYFE